MLKTTYRQYQQCAKVQTMLKNNLISLLDTAFPDANCLFTSPAMADGSEKWVDFVAAFPYCECVCELSEKAFVAKYQKWCKKHGYYFSQGKALDIYTYACGHFIVMPPIPPNSWWIRLCPNSGPLLPTWPRAKTKYSPWPHRCRNTLL